MYRFVMIAVSLVIGSELTAGCTCVTPPVHEALASSDMVFVGAVRDVTATGSPRDSSSGAQRVIVSFSVSRLIKGTQVDLVTLYTSYGGTCSSSVQFQKGGEYLVFAFRRPAAQWLSKGDVGHPGLPGLTDDILDTSECERTGSLTETGTRRDLEKLLRITRSK